MTTKQIKKRVEKLEQVYAPRPPADHQWIRCFGADDEPHGKYRYRISHLMTGKMEPLAEEQELALMKDFYEYNVPAHAKRVHEICNWGGATPTGETYSWATFEDFCKSHECKCGKQHPYADPNYRSFNKWNQT